MIKRFVILLLVILGVVLSCAHADDTPAAPAVEDGKTEQVPPGVTVFEEKEPVPADKEQFEKFIGGGGGFIPTGGITYRWRYTYPYAGGFRYGWRYPITYWKSFGQTVYGSGCQYARPFGTWFYC
uniref:Lipoprotein n=1 Tax=Peronospora matthiolae TaxID=2874970 RepID=A0AAV1SZ38_9STRA